MECSRINELFSEYIDGILDEQTRRSVDEHLAGCRVCAEELRELRDCVGMLGSLGKVRAPADFLEKVHARIELDEKASWLSRIKSRLSFRRCIRIPLEVAGLAAAALLVVFIHQGAKRERAPEHAPSQLPRSVMEERDLETGSVPQKEQVLKDAVPPLPAQAPEGAVAPARPPMGSVAQREAPVIAAAPREPSVGAVSSGQASSPAAEAEPLRLVLLIGQPPSSPAAGAPRGREAAKTVVPSPPAIERKSERMAAAARRSDTSVDESTASFSAVRPEAEKQLLGGKSENSAQQALAEIRSFALAAGGGIDAVMYDSGASQPKSLTIRIPSRSFQSFLEQLRRLGRLEGPAETWAPPSGTEPLLVQIIFEPAS